MGLYSFTEIGKEAILLSDGMVYDNRSVTFSSHIEPCSSRTQEEK